MITKYYEFNQTACAKYEISIADAYILHYLKNFFESGAAERIDVGEKSYFKIYYSKILDDNPILQFGEENLRKVMRKLENKGFIEKYKTNSNATTMFMRICDRKLVYEKGANQFKGRDTMLANYSKGYWAIKKNGKAAIELYTDDIGVEHLRYSNTFLSPRFVSIYYDHFVEELKSNLQLCLSKDMYKKINTDCVYIYEDYIELSTKYQLSTEKSKTFTSIFDNIMYQIENAICLTYINIFKMSNK